MNTPTFEPSRCLPIRSTRCWNGPRWTLGGAFRKSDSCTRARTWTTPAPALPAHVYAVTSALAASLALIAATTCAAVLVSAPVEFVARLTVMSLPVMSFGATVTRQRRVRHAGVAELRADLVAALLAPGLGGEHDRAGRCLRGG